MKFINDKFISDNPSVSSMSIHEASITAAFTDKCCIPCKIKKKYQKCSSQEKRVSKKQTTQVKNQKWIVSLMKII